MSSSPVEYSIAPAGRDPYKERRPPYSEDAEQAVLGAMLMDADAVMRAAESVDDTMFYREGHRRIFRSMIAITERGDVIDPLTLADELGRRGELEASGGKDYIAYLSDAVPTAANVEYHAKIVREKALLRRLIEVSTTIVGEAFEARQSAAELLDEAESRIFQVAQAQGTGGFTRIKELLWPAMERIEQLHREGRAITGVPTGFTELDEMTSGFQPADLIIVAARPSMGKCLAHDAEIALADGSVATIGEIVRRRHARLLTLDDGWRLRLTGASDFIDDGVKPTFRVTTRLGRSVVTTVTHPFRTLAGWRPLAELRVGDAVAVPRRIGVFGTQAMRDCEVKLLAYLIGDGNLTQRTPRFTNSSSRILDDFAAAAAEFGGVVARPSESSGRAPTVRVRRDGPAADAARTAFAVELRGAIATAGMSRRAVEAAAGVSPATVTNCASGATAPDEMSYERLRDVLGTFAHGEDMLGGARARAPNALAAWLDRLGLAGQDAHGRFVPACVFTLPRPQLALFLNRLFATDGWACVLKSGQSQLGYATVSERLARQVQHLLLRFGVVGSLRRRQVRYADARRTAWQLDITDAVSIAAFASAVGIFGKEAALARAAEAAARSCGRTNRDLLPMSAWDLVERAKGDESWASLARRSGIAGWTNVHVRQRRLTRARLAAFAAALREPVLQDLASSDVYWDDIVSIEYVGDQQVYDLTVPDTHNFVANDVCVHNTALTLNMAQHAAIECSIPVAFFSLEMSKDSLVQRLLTSEARIDAQSLRKGRLRDDDFPRLARAAGILSHAPIYIDDTPGITLLEMRSKARRLKAESGLGLIIVDYLQLIQGPSSVENRQQEISMISRSLKGLAKELSVPVMALSQLSRAPEQRTGDSKGRPQLSDLRESGAIEQDADVVLAIYRPEVYADKTEGPPVDKDGNSLEGRAEIIILKQRNGPIGTVQLFFQKQYTRFENYTGRKPPSPDE